MANTVDDILAKMKKAGRLSDNKAKGNFGEDAAIELLLPYFYKNGGLLYHSFRYPYATDRHNQVVKGNIFYEDGVFISRESTSYDDEIDVLYVTERRIFVIEVKSYSGHIKVYDHWVSRMGKESKSPIWQTEKHCRHLYNYLWEVLPDGKPEYIQPICCFVGECKVTDTRSNRMKQYIPVCVLNQLKKKVENLDIPLRNRIDVPQVEAMLKRIASSINKKY